jgi:hypothetical protein
MLSLCASLSRESRSLGRARCGVLSYLILAQRWLLPPSYETFPFLLLLPVYDAKNRTSIEPPDYEHPLAGPLHGLIAQDFLPGLVAVGWSNLCAATAHCARSDQIMAGQQALCMRMLRQNSTVSCKGLPTSPFPEEHRGHHRQDPEIPQEWGEPQFFLART